MQAGTDFPNADMDFCVGYVTASGVLSLKKMFKTSHKVRAVVGVCVQNKVSAFQRLQDFGAEVYLYTTGSNTIFHPKIYFGAAKAQVWAMIGSSNLTWNGLSANVERNILITGQRYTEPFVSIETQIATLRNQSYAFNSDIERKLIEIEKNLGGTSTEFEYKKRLSALGIKPKMQAQHSIPLEAQEAALETLFEFAKSTRLEYAYQMLLLLAILSQSDSNGCLTLEQAADCFINFYKLRTEAGLTLEKSYNSRRAIAEVSGVSRSKMRQMLKTSPFPRFERQGLLDISEDNQYFILNPALLVALTPVSKIALQAIAIQRIAEHFGEEILEIEEMVIKAIG
ncbi:MAG: hypothetical protein NVSMB70_16140 [Chamaesiphon sp.]